MSMNLAASTLTLSAVMFCGCTAYYPAPTTTRLYDPVRWAQRGHSGWNGPYYLAPQFGEIRRLR
jgi:hypothetical protein